MTVSARSDAYRQLLDKAHECFGFRGRGIRGQARSAAEGCYVPSLALLTPGTMRMTAGDRLLLADPVRTLLPEARSGYLSAEETTSLPLPHVMFVVGQYGVGKTELIHQLGIELDYLPEALQHPALLPIALADCREEFEKHRHSELPDDPLRVLLAHLIDPSRAEEQLSNIAAAARAGELIIALDAVDELIADRDGYDAFLATLCGLIARLSDGDAASPRRLRLIVTTRLECLQAVGDPLGRHASECVRNDRRIATYFMRFEVMGEADTLSYLEARLEPLSGPSEPIGDVFTKYVDIFRMLQRPLLARIFCDLCESRGSGLLMMLQALQELPNLTTLISTFVAAATKDTDLDGEQQLIQEATINTSALAKVSAELFSVSHHGFEMEDIRKFVRLGGSSNSDEDEDLRYLYGLHKCPFLIVDINRKRADFAHRIFEEYFTALGLWQTQKDAEDEFPKFDELVLNVDMRKLLKGIVIADREGRESAWYDETRHSYGLEDSEGWENTPADASPPVDELDELRRRILDIMTDADASVRDRHGDIWRFLEMMERHFHPRYAVFNYEGVAVYLFLFGHAEPEAQRISEAFSRHLQDRISKAFDTLAQDSDRPHNQLRAYELLIERIFSVALRLDYRVITHSSIWERIDLVKGDDVRKRILVIRKQFQSNLY